MSSQFAMFDSLPNVEKFELRNVNLQSMEQMAFAKYLNLVYLDLSFNNLTRLVFDSFVNLKKLESLDLSYNQISFIDGKIFSVYVSSQMKPLSYLNLEHNQIVAFEDAFMNYCNIVTMRMSFNFINSLPILNVVSSDKFFLNTRDLYFNNNNITKISFINNQMSSLSILNLDFN